MVRSGGWPNLDKRSDMSDRTCLVDGCDGRVKGRGWCEKHYMRWIRRGDPLAERPPARPPAACTVESCDRPAYARSWCRQHYRRWKETGDVRAEVPIQRQARCGPDAICTVDDCGRPAAGGGHGWCGMHYNRWRQHGDPLKVAWIRGNDRARIESRIDRSGGPDACHPWTAGQNADGYGWVKVGRTQKGAHLALWELENGPVPPGFELDHECHNRAMREGLCAPGHCAHRLCCNLRHIVPRTRDDHAAATLRLSSSWHGDGKGYRKLTEAQVRELKGLLREGAQTAEMADRFGISRTHVSRIRTGKAWGWLAA